MSYGFLDIAITPRVTEAEIVEAVRPLRDRLALLETENAALRAQLCNFGEKS